MIPDKNKYIINIMKLFIKFLENKSKIIYIDKFSTIYELKKSICTQFNITSDIVLFYQGKLINTNENFTNLSTIHVSLSMKGGIPIGEMLGGVLKPVEIAFNAVMAVMNRIWDKLLFNYEVTKDTIDRTWDKIKHSQTVLRFLQFMAFLQRMLPILYLVLIILAFFGKPLEYIMLFVAMISVSILYVIYAIITLPPFIFIPMLIWFIIFDIIPLIVYCLVFGGLLVIILLFCLILAIINTITGGALKSLVLCQNSPAAWYKTPNYHFTNKYERGLFCSRPCFPRYQPDTTGMNCTKLPKDYPAYCPQAEIMRLYTGLTKDNVFMYNDYNINGNVRYLTKTPLDREEILKKHYLKKVEFMNICNSKLQDYTPISLAICSAVDIISMDKSNPLTHSMKKKDINRLINVCKQAFCNSKNNYPFCSQLGATNEDDDSMIVKKVIKLIIMIIIFILILVFSLNYFL
jgi:hypothetical protein